MIGQTLGHYRLMEKIGAGGMGDVYRAEDEHLDRDVAIKVLRAGTLANEGARRRFRKEAIALSKLNHPNIQTVYDFTTQEGMDFLAVELVLGSTLSEKLEAGPLAEQEISSLGSQIAAALEEAHECGVVHCDLKPSNIKVTPKGQVKVLDFGIAKLLRPLPETVGTTATTAGFTETQVLAGTLPYMAPEQLRGDPIDARTDIWSAGVVLYEMATGHHAFEAKLATALAGDIQHKAVTRPSQHNPKCSPRLEEIILKCLEKKPQSRYQSAKEFALELRRLAGVTDEAYVAATPPGPPQPFSSNPVSVIALLGLGIILAVIVAAVLETRGNTSDVLPYWFLSVLNLVVLAALAATLLALDPRGAAVRAFSIVLILRGIVGVTATLGDGASFAIARWAIGLDAACSTLFSGALTIFVLLYPHRRPWAGSFVLGAIAVVTLVLAGVALAIPSALGAFSAAPSGTLAVISTGPLLSERTWYWGASALCAAILAVEHARVARLPELRRSVLLVGIGLATFPIYIAATIVQLPSSVSRAAFAAYGGATAAALGLLSGATALVAALVFAATELRHHDRRSTAGTLLACGIAAGSAFVGVRFGGVPTIAGSVSFLLRGVWRFPLPILATYALLRHHLLGIDVRLKWTIRRGTLGAIFLAVFLIVAQFIQNFANARLGYLAGAVATGFLLFFALAPLQRLSERFADAAFPRVRDPRAAPPAGRLDAYRQAAELLLADGVLTPQKERALAALADELEIGAIKALEVRQRVLARS